MKVLVVTNPFAGREIGEVISDPAAMKEVRAGEHAGHVVAAEYDGALHEAEAASAPAGRPCNKPAQE